MSLRRRLAPLALLAILVSACGQSPTVAPSGSAAASGSASPGGALGVLQTVTAGKAGLPIADTDINREQLIAALGLDTSLGSEADQILGLIAETEGEARTNHPLDPIFGGAISVASPLRIGGGDANLVAFKTFPSPNTEMRDFLAGSLDGIGRAGAGTAHQDLGTETATESDGGRSATTSMKTTLDATVTGSDVRLEIDRDIHNTVTDTATGSTILEETKQYKIIGELDACPTGAGTVPASVAISAVSQATTTAGPDGRVGTHATASLTSTSTFQGQVDDSATLGNVSQQYTHEEKFKRTASADGGPESTREGGINADVSGIGDGVPGTNSSLTMGDWGKTTVDGDRTGDGTDQMISRLPGSAAVDFMTIDKAYTEAQKLWRHSRCVIVTAPTYIPASAFDFNGMPTHTEEVDKGSTSEFQVGLGHRFGKTVDSKILVELDGKDSIDPSSVPKPPGMLTYKAPDEDGKDANVRMTSTSRQGIGTLVLTFHTGAKRLSVTLSGTQVTTGLAASYTATITVPKVVLSKQSDGTYLGSGAASAKFVINADVPCTSPLVEHGTLVLRATRQVVEDEALARRWYVTLDPTSTFLASGSCLGIPMSSLITSGPNGFIGTFMDFVGQLTFDQGGGTVQVKKTVRVGPVKNVISATAKGTIDSQSGP